MKSLLILAVLSLVAGEEVVETWPDGTVRARYSVDAEGLRSGSYQSFHANGKRAIKATYKHGRLTGSYTEYFSSGKKALDCKYKDGELNGKYTAWDEEGHKVWLRSYDRGKLDGKCQAFTDGKLRVTQVWDQGVLEEIEGLTAHPRSLEEVRGTLLTLTSEGAPLPGSPPSPEIWGTAPEEEQRDPGITLARERGLRTLVAYRWLCGAPHEGLRLDPELNRLATLGAKLCAAIGHLDHTPDNPGWPEEEYRDGYKGTSHSNLATVAGLRRSVHMYMDDSDPSNIDRLGHRRWCLSPGLGRVGLGHWGGFSAMYVMAGGGKGVAKGPVAYPPPGYVPVEYFGERYAWSIDTGRAVSPDELTITVRPLDAQFVPQDPLPLDYLGRNGSMLIFRPAGVVVENGRAYLLEIDGLTGKKRFGYLVEFFELEEQMDGPDISPGGRPAPEKRGRGRGARKKRGQAGGDSSGR